jgi:DnaK suppressor protein
MNGVSPHRNFARQEFAMTKDTTLTAAQLKELTFELQVERARLKRARLTHDAERAAADVAGTGADGASEAQAGVALVDADTDARLDAVEVALERIENRTYGTCTGCNQPIPYGRLIVMPEATHCVNCWPA